MGVARNLPVAPGPERKGPRLGYSSARVGGSKRAPAGRGAPGHSEFPARGRPAIRRLGKHFHALFARFGGSRLLVWSGGQTLHPAPGSQKLPPFALDLNLDLALALFQIHDAPPESVYSSPPHRLLRGGAPPLLGFPVRGRTPASGGARERAIRRGAQDHEPVSCRGGATA